MALVIPTAETAPTFAAQAVLDATDLGAVSAATQLSGVLTGCQVAAQSSPNMTVTITAGTILVTGVAVTCASVGSLTVGAASASDRRDIVVIGSGGAASVIAGTPCGTAGWTTSASGLPPVKPAVPAKAVLVGEIYVASVTTSIVASNLVDKTAPVTAIAGYQVGDFWNAPACQPGNWDDSGFTAGVLYAVPLSVPAGSPPLKTLSMAFDGGGGTVLLGVYSDVGSYPGTLLASTSISSPSYSSATGTLSGSLFGPWPARLWLVCLAQTGGMANYVGPAPSGVLPVAGRGSPNNNASSWLAYINTAASYTSGPLPSTFPAGATINAATGSANAVPLIWAGF